MEMWMSVAEFAAKTFLVVFAVAIIAILIAVLVARTKATRDSLTVENLNKKLSELEGALRRRILTTKGFKSFAKKVKKQKLVKEDDRKRLYVLQFDGDVRASAVDRLREEVTAVLTVARPETDEVVLKIESPGGMVHSYGLAATQLLRLRERNIPLTVCVDKVAASGGYLMACTANKILAAPFAIVGSIGVLAQVPNVHRLLKNHNIDYEEVTAGEYKRTMSVMGEVTPQGREKFQQKIEATHGLFKDFVTTYRPKLRIEEVGNGDYWYGKQAIELGLIDELMSSDAYIFQQRDTAKIFKIELHAKKKLSDRLAENFGNALERALIKGWKSISTSEHI